MRAFKFTQFRGLSPRTPDHLLQPNDAAIAENCDFAYGQLQSLRGPRDVGALAVPAQSLWSEDGEHAYAGTVDADVVISPLQSGAKIDRLYYTTETNFRVTTRSGATSSNIGEPTWGPRVGVPKPSKALDITLATPVEYDQFVAARDAAKAAMDAALVLLSQLAGQADPIQARRTQLEALIQREKDYPPQTETNGANTGGSGAIDVYQAELDQLLSNYGPLLNQYAAAKTDAATKTDAYNAQIARVTDIVTETRAYVYTYVNEWGEEGPPSPPTVVDVKHAAIDGAPSSLLVKSTIVLDSFADYVPLAKLRFYRTQNNGGISDDYYYVGEGIVAPGAATLDAEDHVANDSLGEILSSQHYYPPEQALIGLTNVGNGILAAWLGSRIQFSEAYKPWAWPPANQVTVPHTIVNSIASGNGMLVTTVGGAHIIAGVAPDAMSQTPIESAHAGAAYRGIARIDGGIAYACQDGIAVASGGQTSLTLSEKFFTRDTWMARYGAALGSMHFMYYAGKLIVFSRTAQFTAFMIRLDEATGTLTELPGFAATTAYALESIKGMYYANGIELYQFADGADLPLRWKSALLVLDKPQNFGAAEAECVGNFTIHFYAGGVLRHSKAVTPGTTKFKLPAGFTSDRWQIDIEGTGVLKWLKVGVRFTDLNGV